jgi:hypothetical protein
MTERLINLTDEEWGGAVVGFHVSERQRRGR